LLSQPPNNIIYRDPNTFVDKKFDLKINDKYQIDEIVYAKKLQKKLFGFATFN
jgi:hypothetical protein